MSAADKPRKLSDLALRTLDIVRRAQRRGQSDMVITEILHALRAQWPATEKSSLSRELKNLHDDGLLLCRTTKRKPAWEVLPKKADQKSWPTAFAYYAPGARPAAPAPAPVAAASTADFY